jgi:hypothetical protein
MSKTSITLPVDSEAARVYELASSEEREAIHHDVNLRILEAAGRCGPHGSAAEERLGSDRAERLRRLRAGCGIWEGRTEIPSRDDSRQDWEDRLQRFGLGG